MTTEILHTKSDISFSSEIAPIVNNLSALTLAKNVPQRLAPLLAHLKQQTLNSLHKIEEQQGDFQICGPDWSRQNSEAAGKDHAEIIIKTYGTTYALPNKDPKANKQALDSGNLDLYMMYKNHDPVGTACMVFNANGWAELGRAASLGGVGNQLIQNLRIIRWLTEDPISNRSIGLFATCRTAPDRNIGTEQNPEKMRGGQAVSHIWANMPDIMVGGLGPLYKKHGALEQFAYTFVANKTAWVPAEAYIANPSDKNFVTEWFQKYQVSKKDVPVSGVIRADENRFSVGYPPLESGITHLVHGEVFISDQLGQQSLEESLLKLAQVEVPFVQVQIPIDRNSIPVQEFLSANGFQAFLFTPGIADHQPPLLWFGKKTHGVPVVDTFWKDDTDMNPFWAGNLALHALRIANKW